MFRKRRPPSDFAAEVEAHLELEAERLRGEGVPPEDAKATARRAFGNVLAAEERFYEAGRWMWADHLRRDLSHAARALRRSPVFTAVAALSLGLGIGANAAIFSFVDALLLRPYAFPDLDALVVVAELHPQQGKLATVRPSDAGHPLSPADFLDLRRDNRSFSAIAAFRSRDYTLVGEGEAERLAGRLVSPELFTLLGVGAARGRTFLPDEAEPGRDGVVLLSHGLWQRRFGGAPDVVGKSVVLNGRAHTVVGVMPSDFNYPPGGVEVWTPLAFVEKDKTERKALSVAVLGRLAPGATLQRAREDLGVLAARLEQAHPVTNTGRIFRAVRLREQQTGITGPFVALFLGASAFVLLIACANVGGLLLTRGLARRRELAVRAALGASRGRLLRQLLAESAILSGLGLVLAAGVAALGAEAVRQSVPPDITKWVAGWQDIRLDARALAFAAIVAVLTSLVMGLRPAMGAARFALGDVLREGGRGAVSGGRRGRAVLVVSQMALALVLLMGAALLVRGVGQLLDRYDRLRPEGVVTFQLRLPEDRYPPGRAVSDFYARLADDLAALPGATSAATVAQLPGDLGPVPGGAVSVEGRSAPGDLDLPVADQLPIGPDYFRTLGLRVVAGRGFSAVDGAEAPPVAVVSESMARRLWPGTDPVGRRVKTGRPHDPTPWREIVGIVEDVTQYWFDAEPRSTVYLPQAQAPRQGAFVLVRTAGEAAALMAAVRARVAALDPALPLDEQRTLRQVVDDGMAILRLAANLLLLLGGVALLISAMGVYGVVAEDVAQRTPELAVRVALGADRFGLLRLVLGRVVLLGGLSLLAGLPAAIALGQIMAGALFGVVRPDAASLAALSATLLAVALLAGLVPALRAASLDPAAVLRAD